MTDQETIKYRVRELNLQGMEKRLDKLKAQRDEARDLVGTNGVNSICNKCIAECANNIAKNLLDEVAKEEVKGE